MTERPKELFEPGELSRTRKNLGDLTNEEAKRMAKILGGEVGIERTAEAVESSYKHLAEQNRRKHDALIDYHPRRNTPRKSVEPLRQKIITKEIKEVKQSYIERVKISIKAFKSEYRIKSFQNLVAAYFSFFPGYKNRINPIFIKTLNSRVFNSLEKLVTSCRILYAGVPNRDIAERKDPYAWKIIKTIVEWDIEGLENEITRLKTFAASVTVESCTNLIRKIYTPIILLSKVHYDTAVRDSIEYLYTLATANLPPKHLKTVKLRKRYTMASGSLHRVFSGIKYGLYPLLLLRISPKAYSFRDLLKFQGASILDFLEIKIDDLVKYREENKKQNKESPTDKLSDEEKTEEETEEESPLDVGISQGLFFLERIFPGAGWLKLKNNPDMFPYFQPILDLDPHIALISPDDPLQKVIILTAILKELFFGFRSIRYGTISDEKGNTLELKDQMDEITDNWYHFLTTLIEKNYLESLTEYSRQLERDSSFRDSDYGKRLEADILWMRKKYIFPHIYLDTPKIMKPRIKISIPKLYNKTSSLKTILERMVLEIWDAGGMPVESVHNPDEEPVFEVESEVAKRVKHYYSTKEQPLLNKDLILSALHITLILDYLLNDNRSPAYTEELKYLFRSEGNMGVIPVYSVKPEDISANYSTAEEQEVDPDQKTGDIDLLSGYPGEEALRGYLKKYISKALEDKEPFTLLKMETRDYREQENKISTVQSLIRIVESSTRQFSDIPIRTEGDTFCIILPETTVYESLIVVKRIMEKTGEELPSFLASVQYKEPWSADELLNAAEEALGISKTFPAPMFTYLDPETGKPEHTV